MSLPAIFTDQRSVLSKYRAYQGMINAIRCFSRACTLSQS